jgi:hypothetical protein
VHSHWDGNSAQILPYLRESGLDAIESLTPEPMCDMTLEDIKGAVGDTMVCLDLIPAIFFLSHHDTGEVLEFTRRVIDMFAPRLILGISDEISQIGQIEKVCVSISLTYTRTTQSTSSAVSAPRWSRISSFVDVPIFSITAPCFCTRVEYDPSNWPRFL